MPELRHLLGGDLFANASASLVGASEGDGELCLVFTIRPLGLCALPISAVQAVCAADGPVRRVPLHGGAGSRFLGLVSVRMQVQMLFDLSVVPSLQRSVLPLPGRDEYLVVAVAADGRTLALRVLSPLRLVRKNPVSASEAQGGKAAKICNASVSLATVRTDGNESPDADEESVLNVCDAGISPNDDGVATTSGNGISGQQKEHVLADASAAPAGSVESASAGDAFAVPVCGSFAMPDAEEETVWLLCVERLFTQLEAEVRNG